MVSSTPAATEMTKHKNDTPGYADGFHIGTAGKERTHTGEISTKVTSKGIKRPHGCDDLSDQILLSSVIPEKEPEICIEQSRLLPSDDSCLHASAVVESNTAPILNVEPTTAIPESHPATAVSLAAQIDIKDEGPASKKRKVAASTDSERLSNALLQFFNQIHDLAIRKIKEEKRSLDYEHWTTGKDAKIAYSGWIDSGCCGDVYEV